MLLGLASKAGGQSNNQQKGEDHRAWQHGIDLVKVGEKLLVVWGSPGNPPQSNVGGDWQHDIYFSWLDTVAAKGFISIHPELLVSLPEAQEPPSVAINNQGTILVTAEDGNGGINQQAGLWNSQLQKLREYPFTIKKGGHSGHVAAMGNQFLVTYGEGWVDRGGWRNLGTGKNIYARTVDNTGKLGSEIRLTERANKNPRDSWPLVAGSDRNWLVVWQRYPEMTLQSALINATGRVVARSQLMSNLSPRYSYDVAFSPEISNYVVAGRTGDHGFVSIVDLAGNVVNTKTGLPPMQPESRIILHWDDSKLVGAYPINPRGIAIVEFAADAINLLKVIDSTYEWDYSGTTGIFLTSDRLLFPTLSTTGLRLIEFKISE